MENIRHIDYDFATSTSLHGLHNALQSKPRIRRVLWIVIVSLSVIGVSSQITQLFINYFTWPTSTSLTIKYVEDIEFPAVTFCNLNRYQEKAVANVSIIYLLWKIVSAVLSIDAGDGNNIPESVNNFLQGNESFSIKNFTKEHGYQLDNSTLLQCDFSGEPCYPNDFEHVFTEYGNCYTFNHQNLKSKRRVKTSGRGLRVLFDIKQSEMTDNPALGYTDAGMNFVIHSPNELPQVETMGLSVGVGIHAYAVIRQLKTINQEYPWGECNPHISLEYHDTYTTYRCLQECKSKYIKQHCGCFPFLLPGHGPECEPGKYYNCAYPLLYFIEKEGLCKAGPYRSNCPAPCQETKYATRVSYSTFPSNKGLHFFSTKFQKTKEYIRENFVCIDIAYEDLNSELTQQQKKLPISELIGDIGGQLGLFCGASCITIIEILEYLIIKSYWLGLVWLLKLPDGVNNISVIQISHRKETKQPKVF
ncbi:acid-sensing ion channel 5-like [Callorhinchus milii]|uniref:acid-sensing ion channel 5-like n=1 Tax=Callorhinchus milii TaxID=7868 RepID=UPI001C3F880B|nr:acid-sensing ion channel 5-like [Callorhinchus milii]